MAWIKVLSANDLTPGQRQVVTVKERKILLINHEGEIYAVDNACPHLKLAMKKGRITEDGAIVCPWHRSAFDLCSGEVKDWTPWPPVVGKAMGMLSSQKSLPVFPVRLEEQGIWVDISE